MKRNLRGIGRSCRAAIVVIAATGALLATPGTGPVITRVGASDDETGVSAARAEVEIRGTVDEAAACAEDEKAAVLLFVLQDCPIANALMPEMNAIIREFAAKGIRFTFVHVDPAVTVGKVREHGIDYGIAAPVVIDRRHELVRRFKPEVTPEAAVVLRDGSAAYCGRINDLFTAFGQRRAKPTHEELRDVLKAVVEGREVTTAPERGIGCYISDLRPVDGR